MKHVRSTNMVLPNGEEVTIKYRWYRGFPGSRYEPPEPAEATILSVQNVIGKEVPDELFETYEEQIMEHCAKDYEASKPDPYESR